jgi:hypothetical protein
MRSLCPRLALVAGCLLLVVAFVAPVSTHGDEWNLMTRFTVNQPFEVPGMVLQPNTPYVIRLYDSPSTRNVVQIYNGDQTHMLTMFMAVSDERAEPADKTLFTFIETQPGFPVPIKEWFYPGRLNGLEFIYPKEQAQNIAQHAREPVLAASNGNLHDLHSITVEAVGPISAQPVAESAANVTETELPATTEETPRVAETVPPAPAIEQEQPVSPEQPATEVEQPTQIAQNTEPTPNVEQQPSTPAPATTEESQELPRTAGELPLIGLIGVLCLGAGVGLRVLSTKA